MRWNELQRMRVIRESQWEEMKRNAAGRLDEIKALVHDFEQGRVLVIAEPEGCCARIPIMPVDTVQGYPHMFTYDPCPTIIVDGRTYP